jgi:lysozyme
MKGIDVNGAKGAVDWPRVRSAGFEFAFLKASEGRTFDDERFNFNRRAAKAAGLTVGAYHYARPDNNTPEAEARHFLRVAGPKRGELLPVLDWETAPPTGAWALGFLRAVERAIGAPPILYTFPDFLRRTGSFQALKRFPLWYARYGPNDGQVHSATPPPAFRFAVHQFTSRGHVPGVGGKVDLNLLKLDSLRPLVFEPAGGGGAGEPTIAPPESDEESSEDTELPEHPEGEGFAGRALEDDGERESLEAEDFDAVPADT